MIYFTIYLKGLHNSTGYVDVALLNDELLKDYQNYLDMGIKAHKAYALADPGRPGFRGDPKASKFVVNLSEIMAITMNHPAPAAATSQGEASDIPASVAY